MPIHSQDLPPIYLEDQSGGMTLFYYLDFLPHKGKTFAVLAPAGEGGERVLIFLLTDPEDPQSLCEVEDASLLNEVFALYIGKVQSQGESPLKLL